MLNKAVKSLDHTGIALPMLLVAGALALPAGAAASSDLVVSSVSNPPSTLPLGDGFNATETVRNQAPALRVRRGKRSKKAFARKKRKALSAQTAGASTTRFYLSADSVLGGGDFRFAAVRGAPSLGPGAGSGATTRLEVPLSAPLGGFHLLACADDLAGVVESSESNNCRASAAQINVARALTSEELIARALARGEISEETALVYGVYLDFEDSRLPSAFQGIDGEASEEHSDALEEAERKWDTLSAATREKLDPFFIPPIYPGSWRDPAPSPSIADRVDPPGGPPGSDLCNERQPAPDTATWNSMDAHGGDVRIWWANSIYPGDQAKAQAIAAAIDSTIWTKLTNLWGKAPTPDSGGQPGVYCRGNTDGLDIILIDRGSPGEVKRYYPKRCGEASPGFMMLNRALTGSRLLGTLAHEFTHTIQIADNWGEACPKAGMLAEALGKWTEDYVYPSSNTEQRTFQVDLDDGSQLAQSYPRLFLRNAADPYMSWSDGLRYPAYMYPFFLNRAYSDISVRTLWDEFKTNTTLNAIKAAADDDGGLDKVWPEFALYNWNREPFTQYSQWDGISHQPPLVQEFGYGAIAPVGTGEELELPTDVKPLSAKYYRYRFTDAVREIEIRNTLEGIQGANVYAMVKLEDGTWKQGPGAPDGGNQPALKLTDKVKKTFCRDKPDEDVDELVLVISNSNATESGDLTEKPKLITRSVCTKSFSGTYSGTTIQSGGYASTIAYHGNLDLDPCTDPTTGCDPANPTEWDIRQGSTLTIDSISGMSDGCTLSAAPQTLPLLGENGAPPGLSFISPDEYYIHIGITFDDRTVLVDFQGPGCAGPVEVPLAAFFLWMVYNNNEPIVPPPNGSIARNNVQVFGDPSRDQTLSFSLTPVAPP